MIPVLTKEFARKLEESEITVLTSRLTAIQELSENPMEVEIKQFGHATAFTVKGIPGPAFNTVRGLTSSDLNEVKGILDFYREKGIPVQFEITPASSSPALLTSLAHCGLYQHHFHSVLYGTDIEKKGKIDPSISIRKLLHHEFDLFAYIYVKGFGLPDFIKQGVAGNNQVLFPINEWSFYLATINGQPAGIGVLHVQNGIATLATATTLPEYRNLGIHQALLMKRVQDAKEKGANLIVGQAKYASTSSNNMEKIGLRLAYTKAIWIQK